MAGDDDRPRHMAAPARRRRRWARDGDDRRDRDRERERDGGAGDDRGSGDAEADKDRNRRRDGDGPGDDRGSGDAEADNDRDRRRDGDGPGDDRGSSAGEADNDRDGDRERDGGGADVGGARGPAGDPTGQVVAAAPLDAAADDRPDGAHGGRRWVLPAALGAVCLASAAGALGFGGQPHGEARGEGTAVTPVLSARRVPDLLAEPVAERRLSEDLQSWLARSPADSCLMVEDAGSPVFEHNPDAPLTGASTQKLLTATALLLALGPDARLETSLVAAEAPQDGVVRGDLFVVGGGDALLATGAWRDHFTRQPRTINDVEQLAQAVADAGVTRVEGSVVGDQDRYDDQRYHPAWPRRFYEQDVVGPIGGLMVNDGFAAFPPAGESDAATVPAVDPGADAAAILTGLLEARGIDVVGPPRSGSAPDGAAEVATLPSPTVAEIVAEMLRDSDNETAEAAIKEVGYATGDEGSWAAGTAAATALLTEAAVPLEGVSVVDGSGLSIDNRLTCDTLVDVLTRPGTGPVIREGLAVAGESGTLAEARLGPAAAGHVRAKTGTLRNVTALAGEVDLPAGGTVTFAYVANVPDPQQITSAQVGLPQLAEVLMTYPRGVDLAQLEPVPADRGSPAGG